MTRLAVIDTGTNSTRLLVAEVAGKSVREIVRHTTITRLGEGVDKAHRLTPDAMSRVKECMARYAATIGELGVPKALIIATSSLRDAADGKDFLESLAGTYSFGYRLLSGKEEAALSFLGATADLGEGKRTLLFDVGGGSTEVVIGAGRQIDFSVSMNLGCVRIRERFFRDDPVSSRELVEATRYLDTELEKGIDMRLLPAVEEAIAVAGTVTTLAAIDLGLETYDRALVHGHVMKSLRTGKLLEMLCRMTADQRLQISTMEPGRADVIVAGALIVTRLLHVTGIDEFTVSERDILDGAALAMAEGRL